MDGRFKGRERTEAEATKDGVEGGADEKPLRPKQCGPYLRSELAGAFREIVEGFVKEARNGGCAHMKLAAELVEEPKGEKPRRKGSAQRMLEELGE